MRGGMVSKSWCTAVEGLLLLWKGWGHILAVFKGVFRCVGFCGRAWSVPGFSILSAATSVLHQSVPEGAGERSDLSLSLCPAQHGAHGKEGSKDWSVLSGHNGYRTETRWHKGYRTDQWLYMWQFSIIKAYVAAHYFTWELFERKLFFKSKCVFLAEMPSQTCELSCALKTNLYAICKY